MLPDRLERQVRVLASERRQAEEQQRAEKEAQEQAYISKLQQYQATIAALDQCNTVLAQDPPVLPAKVGDSDGSTGVASLAVIFSFVYIRVTVNVMKRRN